MGIFDLFKNKQAPKVDRERPVEPETSMEEDLLGSIKQFRNQQSSVREKFLKENDEKLAPSHEKIERAENFISESGLNKSFPKVIKHIWHWASWSKKDSFEKYTAFKVSNISGEKDGLREWSLSFDYEGNSFLFSFKEQKSYYEDDSQYSDMALSFDGEKVLEISCISDLNREYDQWSYLSIKHLVISDWVRSIVEMDELIELYDIKSSREFGESMFKEQAENLPD